MDDGIDTRALLFPLERRGQVRNLMPFSDLADVE